MQPLLQWKSSKYYIPYCECVFLALVIQHVMRLHNLSIVTFPGVKYFSTLSHKRHDFRKITLLNGKLCFDFLYS